MQVGQQMRVYFFFFGRANRHFLLMEQTQLSKRLWSDSFGVLESN